MAVRQGRALRPGAARSPRCATWKSGAMSGWSVADLHRAEVWTAVAPSYDAAIAPIMKPYAATMLDLLGVTRDAGRPKLLDVAAGTGVMCRRSGNSPGLRSSNSPGLARWGHVIGWSWSPGPRRARVGCG